jgi:hypothetical protein
MLQPNYLQVITMTKVLENYDQMLKSANLQIHRAGLLLRVSNLTCIQHKPIKINYRPVLCYLPGQRRLLVHSRGVQIQSAMAPNICGSPVRKLLHVSILTLIISMLLQYYENICAPLFYWVPKADGGEEWETKRLCSTSLGGEVA